MKEELYIYDNLLGRIKGLGIKVDKFWLSNTFFRMKILYDIKLDNIIRGQRNKTKITIKSIKYTSWERKSG